eukprot:scaffold25944_cov71-Phaeocystis_antarctica.AAC.3
MCAERSSTRHAASVGRSARRRVNFATPITPDSRADGSANGGAHETAMSHGKARRQKRSAAPPPTAAAATAPPGALCSTACTIVPLYPNDDTPPIRSPRGSGARPVGSAHATPRSAAPTRGLSSRSCALGGAAPWDSPLTSTSRPAKPAADSAWPLLALTLPAASPAADPNAPAHAPTSIGSPSAVPVPWASSLASRAASMPLSAIAARSSACCAWPFGA